MTDDGVEKTLFDSPEETAFCSDLQGTSVVHNEGASWIEMIETELEHVQPQENKSITKDHVEQNINKIPKKKSPSADGIYGFW